MLVFTSCGGALLLLLLLCCCCAALSWPGPSIRLLLLTVEAGTLFQTVANSC
jgi:hypothetical protein